MPITEKRRPGFLFFAKSRHIVCNCAVLTQRKEEEVEAEEEWASRSRSSRSLERLWEDYFRDPSQWWDKRNCKVSVVLCFLLLICVLDLVPRSYECLCGRPTTQTNPKAPDFRHKYTEQSLWIKGWNNPSWVQDMLRQVEGSRGEEEEACVFMKRKAGSSNRTVEDEELVMRVHNSGTYVALLKACTQQKDLLKGIEIHTDIVRSGILEKDVYIGSSLINMYAKCGSLAKAQEVFDTLAVHNVVTWSALIAGYAQHGCGKQALHYFERMQLEGVSPNAVSFVCALKACGSIGDAKKGQEIHADISTKRSLRRDVFVGNALIDMYGKCGSLEKAQEVFNQLPFQDVVSWNALMAGFVQHGFGEEALKSYQGMKLEGPSPDVITYSCILKACGSLGATKKGLEIHAEMSKKGLLERDSFVGSSLVDMYIKCGALTEAQEVFNELPLRNVVMWNTLITGYIQHGCSEEALNCFEQMRLAGLSPDAVTFICISKACGILEAVDKGQEIHVEVARKGYLKKELSVGNALIDMYVKFGLLAKAHEVFDNLPLRNVVSWSTLVAGYVQHGLGEEALNCYRQMENEGITPTVVTFISIVKACGDIGAIGKGEQIHTEIAREGLLESDAFIGNALVDMYAKCGSLSKAQDLFDKLRVRDHVSWNALLAGYAQFASAEKAFDIFDKMIADNVIPNLITFVSLLNACSHAGLVEKGLMYFQSMRKNYGIVPGTEHQSCMIDLLGRAGQLDKAIQVIKEMPFSTHCCVALSLGCLSKVGPFRACKACI